VKKNPLIVLVIVLAGMVAGVWMLWNARSLHSAARRSWKQRSLAEISARVADPRWASNELARLRVAATNDSSDGWLSDQIIVMKNGEWLAYANICQKENWRVRDLFVARGSDGRWYYSTYHFCISMVVLRMDEQPENLAQFTKTYFLRVFDGQSDDCLQQTWPTERKNAVADGQIEPTRNRFCWSTAHFSF
jgi:hypothetical protein